MWKNILYCTAFYLSWGKMGGLVWNKSQARIDGYEETLPRGSWTSSGGSAEPLFVVFLLRREEGYFPEPERRISIARPPSPAAHMTSNAGKPLKTSRKRGTWWMMGSGARHQHQLSAALQQRWGLVNSTNDHSKTLRPGAKTSGKWHRSTSSLHLRASSSTHAVAFAHGLVFVVRWCHFPKNTRLLLSSSFTSCWFLWVPVAVPFYHVQEATIERKTIPAYIKKKGTSCLTHLPVKHTKDPVAWPLSPLQD